MNNFKKSLKPIIKILDFVLSILYFASDFWNGNNNNEKSKTKKGKKNVGKQGKRNTKRSKGKSEKVD